MKIAADLFTELSVAVSPHMPHNATMRQRWDALWASKFPVNKLYNSGLNDNHIDTALRQIAPEV